VVDPDGNLHVAATRDGPDAFSIGQPVRVGVLGTDVEALATPHRRRVTSSLDPGVVRVEPATRGEPDREVVVELVNRRIVIDGGEGHAIARNRVLPEP
jgi:hypothetical protein